MVCFGLQFQDTALISVHSGLNIKIAELVVEATPFMVEESNKREGRKAPEQNATPKDTVHACI